MGADPSGLEPEPPPGPVYQFRLGSWDAAFYYLDVLGGTIGGIEKVRGSYDLYLFTTEALTYSKGCFGLVQLRLGTDPYNPANYFFLNVADAEKKAAEIGQFAVIFAIQYKSARDYEYFCDNNYPSRIQPPPRHAEGNHATWIQVAPGNGFWEYLGPNGWNSQTDANAQDWIRLAKLRKVTHSMTLPSYDITIYGVAIGNWNVRTSKFRPVENLPLKPTPAP
jgi:hypothetical protein